MAAINRWTTEVHKRWRKRTPHRQAVAHHMEPAQWVTLKRRSADHEQDPRSPSPQAPAGRRNAGNSKHTPYPAPRPPKVCRMLRAGKEATTRIPCGDLVPKLASSHVSEPRLAQTPEGKGGQRLRVATSASLAQQKTHAPVEPHCMDGRCFRGCAHARLHKRPNRQHPRPTRLPIAHTLQIMLWQRVTLHRLVGR